MLGKLIKHEFSATARYFLPLYAFIIVLTPLFSLVMKFSDMMNDKTEDSLFMPSLMIGMSVAGYVLLMIGIFAGTFILIVLRFYRTIATSEAYLTFTLPVKSWQIMFSKTLAAFVWQIVTGILAIGSIFTMTFIAGLWEPSDALEVMSDLLDALPMLDFENILTLLILLFSLLMGILAGIGRIYFSISLGQIFPEHRILFSIGFYFAMYIALQIISVFISLPITFTAAEIESAADSHMFFNVTYLVSGIENALISAVCFIGSAVIIKKHLNVK